MRCDFVYNQGKSVGKAEGKAEVEREFNTRQENTRLETLERLGRSMATMADSMSRLLMSYDKNL